MPSTWSGSWFDSETPSCSTRSFVVPRSTSLAVIGPNGAGKTVLFKALIGALPHEGTIRWAERTRVGYVPQKLDLERDLPVTGQDFLHAKAVVTGSPPADVERDADSGHRDHSNRSIVITRFGPS